MKTRVLFFILTLLLVACENKEQLLEDEKKLIRFYGAEGDDIAYDIAETSDGGFLILGQGEDTLGRPRALLLRADVAGNLLWQKHYGNSDVDILRDLLLLPDGSFLMAGQAYNANTGVLDGWMVHAYDDSDHADRWSRQFGIEPVDKSIHNILQLPDGKLAAVGEINHGFWMLLTNAQGDVIFERSHGILTNSSANSVAYFEDDSVLVACGFSGDHLGRVAYDLEGNLAWEDLKEGGLIGGRGVAIDRTGLVIVNTALSGSGQIAVLHTGAGANSLVGAPLYIDYSGDDFVLCRSINHPSGGLIVLVGSTTSFSRASQDVLIVCLTTDGRSVVGNAQHYGGRYYDEVAVAVTKTRSGYALVGHSDSFAYNGRRDIFLMKLDEDGVLR